MNKYLIEFTTIDGFEGCTYIYAANRIAALMEFEEFGYDDIVNLECFRVLEDEEEEG